MYEAESSAGRVSVAFGQLCSSLSGQANSPYTAAMFAYLASGNWSDVVESINLPLRDRLGIALRFLGDDKVRLSAALLLALSSAARDLARAAQGRGDPRCGSRGHRPHRPQS